MQSDSQKADDTGLFATLLERLVGPQQQLPPEIAEALKIVKKERPDLADVELYGPLSRLFMNKAQGYVSPGQTIYLNPDQLKGFPAQEIADTLIHEQTHVDQMKRRGTNALTELLRTMFGPNEPYGQRPDEIEAFQAEKLRRSRMNRMQTAKPSFTNPGEFIIPQDIHLRPEKKRKQ